MTRGGSRVVDDGNHDDRSSVYGAACAQAVAGNGTAMVVQEPLSRLAQTALLPGMH
jgi:hypothetical protein